jgi:HEAT repeat protein
MLTFYCPSCWSSVREGEKSCPNCGYDLAQFTNLDYEEKLLAALRHPVPERRMMAANILGSLGSVRALPEFLRIIENGKGDYYFLREILLAKAKINHPERITILEAAKLSHSQLISSLANDLLAQVTKGDSP